MPAFLLYSILFVLPCVMGIWFSFTNWNMMNMFHADFIGLANFKTIFIDEKQTYISPIFTTLIFAGVTSILEVVFGISLAMLLNNEFRSKSLLRSIFFLPSIMAPLIIGYIFTSVYQPSGVLNNFLNLLGLDALSRAWLIDNTFALPAVMATEVWRYIGMNMVIFIAGLQMIPKAYYESASIDGASKWKEFLHITLPCIIPSITINAVLNVIHGLNVFDIIFSLTNGGPGNKTEVLNTVVYREFSSGRYGLASAVGVIVFVITLLIAFTMQVQLSKREIEGL